MDRDGNDAEFVWITGAAGQLKIAREQTYLIFNETFIVVTFLCRFFTLGFLFILFYMFIIF